MEDAEKTAEQEPNEAPEQAKDTKKRRKRSTARLLGELGIKLAVIAAAVFALLTFVIGLTIHYGNNMFPAIKDGDLVIAYRLQDPYLNAAVLYKRDGATCTGRVVGMPGDVIDITQEGAITVNGIAPAEEIFYATTPAESGGIQYPYTVPEGSVFILNDFRADTNDSRSFGAVDKGDVMGPVLLTIRRRGF